MNFYAAVILGALILEHGIHLAADFLNLGTLSGDIPGEFRGILDAQTYRKSQEYTRVRLRFGMIKSLFDFTLLIAFWFIGGFNSLDQIVRSWGFNWIVTGLFYVGCLLLLRAVASLPFTIYSTFVIEERFGFNKTTAATFIADRLKGALLGVLLGAPLLAGILALFAYAGRAAWLYCWAVSTLFTLIVQFVAPTWIMPLFNKFTPLPAGELRDSIISYAASVRFTLQNVFLMDGSKRSSKSNAFFTGFGKNKRIALFDTLVAKHSAPELLAVLAHEIGHYKKKHIVKGIVLSVLHTGLIFFLLSFFINERGLYDAFFMQEPSVYTGLVFFGLLYTPIELIFSIVLNVISRKHEFEADRFAVETTRAAQPMVDALMKLSVDNLSHMTPHPLYVFLNYSHPPILHRIRAIGVQQSY
jgi:STE24 endopeptidase